MTKLQIRMRQVDQVKDFVDLLSKYPYEMDLVSGRYTTLMPNPCLAFTVST